MSTDTIDWIAAKSDFERDGVVCLKGLLGDADMQKVHDAFEWSLAHPGPLAKKADALSTADSKFYSDLSNFACLDAYGAMLRTSPIPDAIKRLWGTSDIWMLYEQIFLREGKKTQRTPWHQDSSYIPVRGNHSAVAWITFEPADKTECLEFVRGSHVGPAYDRPVVGDGPAYHDEGNLPMPDIEANRGKFDLVSWNLVPGDVIIFHASTLHGGSSTDGKMRRTLSLRFFGSDAVYRETTAERPTPILPGFHERMRTGEPFRDPAFLRL